MTKYLDPPSVGIGARPQISEYIRSKGAKEKESLLLKGNFVCFPKWQEVQSKFWNWTEPKWPWEVNNWRQDKDGWPRRASHRSGEGVAVVAVVETTCEEIFKSWTSNMQPTLRLVPSTWLIQGSCTSTPQLVNRRSMPNSQSWPTESKLKDNFGIWKVSLRDKQGEEIVHLWLIGIRVQSTV